MKILKNCIFCSQDFYAELKELRRGNAKFCSRSCGRRSRKSKVKHPNNVCAYCGIEFYRQLSSKVNSKSGLTFCCRAHKDLAQRIGGLKEIQPTHYGTQLSSYKDLAKRYLPNICNRCGYDKHDAALVVHHVDHNRDNNELSNLEILCANCHAIEHWA